MIHITQVDRSGVPRPGVIGALVIGLQPADFPLPPFRQNFEDVPSIDAARDWDACQNRAKTFGTKNPLDRHAKDTVRLAWLKGTCPFVELLPERIDPLPRGGG